MLQKLKCLFGIHYYITEWSKHFRLPNGKRQYVGQCKHCHTYKEFGEKVPKSIYNVK